MLPRAGRRDGGAPLARVRAVLCPAAAAVAITDVAVARRSIRRSTMTPSNASSPVLWSVDPHGVARVVLNRPEVNNAYDGALIEGLLAALAALADTPSVRAVVIAGNGRHFQAGADLKWIDQVRTRSADENVRVSRATALAVHRLNHVAVPTVAL